jgi:hypothetical protein
VRGVDNCPMTYGNMVFENGNRTRVAVENRPILNIGVVTYLDFFHIRPYYRTVPDTRTHT